MKKLVLIDGSGYIFRAFYALPPMTKADGTPVGAVYGFMKMLMKLMKNSKADYMAVVFDAARKNFRNDIYPDYKATRKETPPELIPQFPLIREAVKAFNIQSLEKEGFEADDLIAAYAVKGLEAGLEVKVVSSDKDMMQLMAKGVTLYDPMKDKVLAEEDVLVKFGVKSNQVLDVMALIGDASDNVPGVSGMGSKTAALLINSFGSLENLLNNIDKVEGEKRKKTLYQEKDLAELSKRLISLAYDAPLPYSLDKLAVQIPDCEDIRIFAKENGFVSLLPNITGWCDERKNNIPISSVAKDYELISDMKALDKWVDMAMRSEVVAFDTETTGLNPFKEKLVGISLAMREGKACYIPLNHVREVAKQKNDLLSMFDDDSSNPAPLVANSSLSQLPISEVLKKLSLIWENTSILKVGHNIKFDMHVLNKAFREQGLDFVIKNIDDTMVMSYVLFGSSHGHGMDELAKTYLDYQTITYKEITSQNKKKISFAEVEIQAALDYAAEDADITLRLFNVFRKQLVGSGSLKIYEELDRPLIMVLYQMEKEGVRVDPLGLVALSRMFEAKMADLGGQIFEQAGENFNINSPAQLGTILFDKMGLEGGIKGANGYYSTDSEVLETLAEKGVVLASLVLQYRSLAKLKSTYTDALPMQISAIDDKVHTSFSQVSTSTGRLSSNDPNLQNIPIRFEEGREIRKMFIADEGHLLISADYSQIELRLMAGIANVKLLKQAFAEGKDIHAITASTVFGVPLEEMTAELRRNAKAINFGIIYGISAFGLAKQLGISRTEAANYIDSYFKKYPEIKRYMDDTIKQAESLGFVTTIAGRKCYVFGINDKNPTKRGFAQRAAINAPIQGSAADVIKKVMIALPKRLEKEGLKVKMILQVHDELIFDCPKEEVEKAKKIIKEVMENIISFPVDLIVDVGVGENWANAH